MSPGDIIALMGAATAVVASLTALMVQTSRLVKLAEEYLQQQRDVHNKENRRLKRESPVDESES